VRKLEFNGTRYLAEAHHNVLQDEPLPIGFPRTGRGRFSGLTFYRHADFWSLSMAQDKTSLSVLTKKGVGQLGMDALSKQAKAVDPLELREVESARPASQENSAKTYITSNSLIVISVILTLILLLLFLEFHSHRLVVHSSMTRGSVNSAASSSNAGASLVTGVENRKHIFERRLSSMTVTSVNEMALPKPRVEFEDPKFLFCLVRGALVTSKLRRESPKLGPQPACWATQTDYGTSWMIRAGWSKRGEERCSRG
jgi:hypothetical protein